jgi:uncharacterized protein YxeA
LEDKVTIRTACNTQLKESKTGTTNFNMNLMNNAGKRKYISFSLRKEKKKNTKLHTCNRIASVRTFSELSGS